MTLDLSLVLWTDGSVIHLSGEYDQVQICGVINSSFDTGFEENGRHFCSANIFKS